MSKELSQEEQGIIKLNQYFGHMQRSELKRPTRPTQIVKQLRADREGRHGKSATLRFLYRHLKHTQWVKQMQVHTRKTEAFRAEGRRVLRAQWEKAPPAPGSLKGPGHHNPEFISRRVA